MPDRFRLFVSGWNTTENGNFLFDDAAAAAVMAAYQAWGVDLAIDLEHQMLSPGHSPDPTAKDARGWCQLELAADGSLWAVNVRWTPDGAARLTEKRQRYISPAFEIDSETNRVTKIVNVAITAIPATHHTPALVAASLGACMDPNLVKEALDALVAGDAEKCMELLKGAIAAAASSEAPAEEPAAEPPAEEMAAEAPPAAEEDPAKKDEEKAATVATSRLIAITGTSSLTDALSAVETFKASHIELETERQKLAKERETLEAAERRQIYADLVKLGGLAPSAVWADDKAQAPKGYLAAMPLENLREFAQASKASRGKPAPKAPAVSASVEGRSFKIDGKTVELSASELAACEEMGAKPEVYAANKFRRGIAAV